MMRILVLGSKGQIGAALVRFLSTQSEEVVEFDIRISAEHDLRIFRNPELINILRDQKIDFAIFLAFDVGGAKYLQSNQRSKEFISNNLLLMESTFSLLHDFRIPFLFASTQMSRVHDSTYGALKSIGEKYTRALGGLNIKLWNVYGVENEVGKFHVISDFVRMALEDKKITMMTNGLESRDMLHADDCAETIYKAVKEYESMISHGEVHIASHSWIRILDIAKIVSSLTGAEICIGNRSDETYIDMEIAPDPKFKEFTSVKISLENGIRGLILNANS